MREIKLFLIRHGKTYCNEKQLYCGKSDVDLSENGICELGKLLKRSKFQKCDYYFTSGAKRANKTLEILCPNAKYDILEKFFEYNFGEFELKGYEELKFLKEYTNWIDDKEGNIKCPMGESRIEFRNRIRDTFIELIRYLVKEDIKSAFGVIHGGSIGIILEMLYDDSKKFYEWQPKNGEGYELIIRVDEKNEFVIDEVNRQGGLHD
ncbi:phosphoglycerate mutase family protein [Clostridium sp.]|uniref:histidine phosphatase family protein n=1 Tax=Clostridium sp. TaxID=1506 RepID=UPI0026115F80|nr:phosphoglycerate mutase family protein [Clostridium sp.]